MPRKLLSLIIFAVFMAGIGAGLVLSPHVMAAAAVYETDVGGGAPTRVLIDNNRLRVTLVTFQKGFTRPGGVLRRADTLIAYIDPGDFKTGGAAAGGGARKGGTRMLVGYTTPLSVRRASALPPASFRSPVPQGTLAFG